MKDFTRKIPYNKEKEGNKFMFTTILPLEKNTGISLILLKTRLFFVYYKTIILIHCNSHNSTCIIFILFSVIDTLSIQQMYYSLE